MSVSENRKIRKPRRSLPEDGRHWLDQGVDTQELLFDEISPLLFALDAELCSEVNRLAHSKIRPTEKRQVLFVPPAGTYGWQVSFLAKHFKVNIWTAEDDESFLRSAEHFGSSVFAGDIPERLRGLISLALFTEAGWKNQHEFAAAVAEVLEFLSVDGRALFCIMGRLKGGEIEVVWADGSSSGLGTIARQLPLMPNIGEPTWYSSFLIELDTLRSSAYQAAFLKRHRDFFGRDARLILERRCQGVDYSVMEQNLDSQPVALLLKWSV